MGGNNSGFGIYVHWPFCAAKCPYCDFNSHVVQNVDQAAWRDALRRDLRSQSEMFDRSTVKSVFFGGGTPSLMPAETVGAILDDIAALWPADAHVEVTLEANPTSVEADKFADFRRAGVNRVSMGVQALNDADLKSLGRMHSAKEAIAAFEIARNTFKRVSFDLIYARQRQSLEAWRDELQHALGLAVDHLSLYQLTIEQGTRFGALYSRGKLADLPSDDLAADMYELTHDLCAEAGLHTYEVSNHARPEAECEHNLIYWRYGMYLGIGPGAHGRVRQDGALLATSGRRAPDAWVADVGDVGHGLVEQRVISAEDQAQEMMIMGLRLVEGVDLSRFSEISGYPIDIERVSQLEHDGLVVLDDNRLSATRRGREVLNSVLVALLA